MNALEELQIEQSQLQQVNPVVKEVEALGFKVTEARAYRHDVTADHRGHIIDITIEDLCLDSNQLKAITTIKGFNWIHTWKHQLEIDLWRAEI